MGILASAPPPPVFADLGKLTKDIIDKDFYHNVAHAIEVRLTTPSGVGVIAKGNSPHDATDKPSVFSGSVEGKLTATKGVTNTLTSHTNKSFTWKGEVENIAAPGFKSELSANYHLDKGVSDPKVILFFKQSALNARASFTQTGAKTKQSLATCDAVVGQDGFLLGGHVGFDILKGEITTYDVGAGYRQPSFAAALIAQKKFTQVQASWYQRVNPAVEVGIRALYDITPNSDVSISVASKYKLDALSFAKAKIDHKGVASLSYNTRVSKGLVFGLGTSFETAKLNSATHKLGFSFTLEG